MYVDYDVFVVPNFTLDSNYNYDIRLVVNSKLVNEAFFNKLTELDIRESKEFNGTYTKILYYCNVSCFVDLRMWLLQLADVFSEFNIKSNLDSKLLDKVKELKK